MKIFETLNTSNLTNLSASAVVEVGEGDLDSSAPARQKEKRDIITCMFTKIEMTMAASEKRTAREEPLNQT
jgi:hypothetical protein